MSELPQLGMTDVASRSRSRGVWKLGLWIAALIGLYAVLRNVLYLRGGMLEPDFELIHAAYDFNLWELPWIFCLIAVLALGLAATWRRSRRAMLGLAFIYGFLGFDLFALRYYVTYVEPERLVIHEIRLETPKLTRPVRVLHVSDIQAGAIGPYEEAIFARMAALKPDLILNTGDFLQLVPPATFESQWPKMHAMIEAVNPRLGTYAVFGDTELESDRQMHLHHMDPQELAPLVMLASQGLRIDTGGGWIDLHGLNLSQSRSPQWAQRSVDDWLDRSAQGDFRILLGHAPDYALGLEEAPIDLCLAGHTHGGQVRLPFYGPLVIDSAVPREWARGFRRVGVPYLNVSAGAGSNRRHGLPPMRFNCPTEMTLIDLVPVRPIR